MIPNLGNQMYTLALLLNGQSVGLGTERVEDNGHPLHLPDSFVSPSSCMTLTHNQLIPVIIGGEAYDIEVSLSLTKAPEVLAVA